MLKLKLLSITTPERTKPWTIKIVFGLDKPNWL